MVFNCTLIFIKMKGTRLFLVGFMGCGKSTFGRKLSKALGYAFIDMDTYIEEREGIAIPNIFAEKGEMYFRQLETQAIRDLSDQIHCVIATGGGAPCYNDNMALMNEIGCTIYLELSPEKLSERLLLDPTERPVLEGRRGEELVDFIASKLHEREVYYLQATYKADADCPDEVITKLKA